MKDITPALEGSSSVVNYGEGLLKYGPVLGVEKVPVRINNASMS